MSNNNVGGNPAPWMPPKAIGYPTTCFEVILRIAWIVVMLGVFILLPFWWAIGIHIFQYAVLPTFSGLAYIFIFRNKLAGGPYVPIASGVVSAIVLIICFTLVKTHLQPPSLILPCLFTMHVVNHLNRIWRVCGKPTDAYEAQELSAFAFVFILMILALKIIFRLL